MNKDKILTEIYGDEEVITIGRNLMELILTAHDQGRPRGKPSSMPDVVMVEINDTVHEQEDECYCTNDTICEFCMIDEYEQEDKRVEFEQYLSEWNGDEPDEREHMTFADWLEDK